VKEPLAETVVCVPGLHEPDLLVEIDRIAVIPNSEGQDACFWRRD
jgi:enamine deaminase RidA (YjgF/YER057c/UK114 family)